jgi:hypothetical protein
MELSRTLFQQESGADARLPLHVHRRGVSVKYFEALLAEVVGQKIEFTSPSRLPAQGANSVSLRRQRAGATALSRVERIECIGGGTHGLQLDKVNNSAASLSSSLRVLKQGCSRLAFHSFHHGDDVLRWYIGENVVNLLENEASAGAQDFDLLPDIGADRFGRTP